jgi:hypothetical protein
MNSHISDQMGKNTYRTAYVAMNTCRMDHVTRNRTENGLYVTMNFYSLGHVSAMSTDYCYIFIFL